MQHKHFDSCDFKSGTCSDQVFILHYQGSERSLPICREPAAFELMLDRTVRRGMREGLAFADKLFPPHPHLQDGGFAEHFMDYEHAIVKVEDGIGTLLCNNCGTAIAKGTQHEDREHFCTMCMSGNCKAKFKTEK